MGSTGIVNADALDTLNTVFHSLWESYYAADRIPDSEIVDPFCEVIPTDALINTQDLASAFPTWREWVGPRAARAFRVFSHSVQVTKYEVTMEIDNHKLQLDRMGFIGRTLRRFFQMRGGQLTSKFATQKLFDNPTGYDGVAIFSTAHPYGPAGATQSNLATSTVPTVATCKAADIAVEELRDEEGETLGLFTDTVMCGPTNKEAVRRIFEADELIYGFDATAAEATSSVIDVERQWNVFRGAKTVIINPRYVGSYSGYVDFFSRASGLKPIVCYEKHGALPDELAEGSDHLVINDKVIKGLTARQGYGAGMWQGSYRMTA